MSTSTFPKGNEQKQSGTEQSPSVPESLSTSLDHEERAFLTFREQGKSKVHYCPEWDYMAIHSLSPEFEACLCDLNHLP